MNEQIILFYGEDTFYIKSKINQLIKQYEVDEYNLASYDLDDVAITDAINDALTIPFMSDKKIVIAQNARFLGNEKLKKAIDHDLDLLANYLNNPSEETIFILTAPIARLDERKAITKLLKKHKVVECKLKSGQDLVSWAKRQIGNQSMSIADDALDEFIKRVKHSTEFAYLEMRKLLLYAHDLEHIDLNIIKKVITKNVEDNVYEITNALLERNHKKALEVYHDLILYSEDPLRILSTLINKYREMLHVRTLLDLGKTQSDIQSAFEVSSGRAYYMVQNAKTARLDQIKEYLSHLEKLDYHIKIGRIDKKIALELFILST
ncbi:MAG: DNA polymerase III subunit delta [Candidatus Izemoplasmataceae bacterium]